MRSINLPSVTILATVALLTTAMAATAAPNATMNDDSDVYADKSISSDIINSVEDGDDVTVKSCSGKWCFIKVPGPDGWVRKKFLDFYDATPPSPPVPPAPPAPDLPYGPDTCKTGFVWRDAIPGDHVCVTGGSRSTVASENASAGARVDPAGAYGANSCVAGYVWREAYVGDVVCVTPPRRTAVKQENIDGPSHRVLP
ncbi:MAG: hypothetical protein ABI216_19420 [Devosia sp.]